MNGSQYESTIINPKPILHHEWLEGYQLVKNAHSILMKISFISVLIARWSVYVLNVSFMVILVIYIGRHKDHDVKTIKKSHPLIKN